MKKLLIVFTLTFVYKVATNISALFRLNYYREKYEELLSDKISDFHEYAPAVRKLFKAAEIKDSAIPFVQAVGHGMLSKGNASFFDNLAARKAECEELMLRNLAAAKGIFKSRLIESFSPLYWVNCIIYLPRKALEYLGLDTNGIACKLVQLIYWIATPFLIAFRDNIYQYIVELFR